MKFLLCFSHSFCFFLCFYSLISFHYIRAEESSHQKATNTSCHLLWSASSFAAADYPYVRRLFLRKLALFFTNPVVHPSLLLCIHQANKHKCIVSIYIYVYPRMFAHTTQYKYINVIEYIHKWNQDFLYRNFRASRIQYSQAFLIAISLIAINTRYRRD